jgi:activator of 2-hydroxyglutaryl-CoA dehydratase/predicted nucleotide-binding protein (sugar kinase/HSP70/actin superfamily)
MAADGRGRVVEEGARGAGGALTIGLDVGSTTVKAVVVDPRTRRILWSDYRRHHTKQPETVLDLLVDIGAAFPGRPHEDLRIFCTGSGSGPLAEPLGARFVQEVNSVTLAVEALHPDAGSVVELGGQDAKIIVFKENERGEKTASCSMNDKCASGTGATIDKCTIKVGLPPEALASLRFDAARLHHVAAKCGVFAETDIVNLVKTGIPADEIMCSLADAIVMQNLSVLTRGSTLRPKVILLGGPNTYLPFLQDCWRKRIPETWDERGLDYPKDVPLEELIVVPEGSHLYAAYGAVLYGLHEAPEVGVYRGIEALRRYATEGRKARLGETAGPGLVRDDAEREAFRALYAIPRFEPPRLAPGATVRAVIGLDGGSTSSKAVLVGEDGALLRKAYTLSKGNPIEDMRQLLAQLRDSVAADGARLEVIGFGATGYAADVLEECLRADVNVVETVAHMISATHYFGDIDVVCDIGGQDIKVLFLRNGDIESFKLSNQCSAGNGMLLQAMADQFGLPVTEYADHAFGAELAPKFSYGCAVFLDTDRVNFQKEGYAKEELLAGLAQVLPKNVWQYVVGVPRLAALGRRFVLQGGTQFNLAAVKAQVDYIKERVPDAEVFVHPHTGEAGAIGAAMETLRVVRRRGSSTFIGLEAAIALRYETKNDESTVCHFCPNECSRTFIDAYRPDGSTARYISGFSCEKGTVESKEAMVALERARQQNARRFPNLIEYEARKAFAAGPEPEPLPAEGTPTGDVEVERGFFGRILRRPVRRGFRRSDAAAAERRRRFRIGLPRVLNMYSTGPFWTAYLRTLGLDKRNIVWSDETTEERFAAGAKYGSVDPCFPSKVVQAHIHQLLFEKHAERPLDAIFFPILTHVPSFTKHAVDHASCPIVAGTPEVIKAAFTKEQDYFGKRGIRYLDPAFSFAEPVLLRRQLFGAFGELLGVTEDESDFAAEQGWKALRAFDADLEARGRAVLEQVEREDRVAILVLGRPYHSDPGLHHGIPDEFQALGYPILSIRSIPKDEAWLAQYFGEDLAAGRIRSPLEINDVWPESYSANSSARVWAAKFAARHPNVVLLDLSSFKCGHDAPTYGIVEGIVDKSGVPHAALHDLDANKPGGSIKIRVKTYVHSLRLHEERLRDLSAKKAELAMRLDEKRLELLREKQRALEERRAAIDPALRAEIDALGERLRAWKARAAAPVAGAAPAGVVRLGKKAADGSIVRVGRAEVTA